MSLKYLVLTGDTLPLQTLSVDAGQEILLVIILLLLFCIIFLNNQKESKLIFYQTLERMKLSSILHRNKRQGFVYYLSQLIEAGISMGKTISNGTIYCLD